MGTKTVNKIYLECNRCGLNNFDKEDFQGCPRGSREVENKGVIKITKKLKKNA